MKKNNSLLKLGLLVLGAGLVYKYVNDNREEIDDFVDNYSRRISDKYEEVKDAAVEKANEIHDKIEEKVDDVKKEL